MKTLPESIASLTREPERHRVFKLVFVPLLIFSLFTQLAIVWTQLNDIREGYFDFVLYYSGAKILSEGNGTQLYDLALQRKYQKEFGAPHKDHDLPFNHLPYELMPFLILANYSFMVAHTIWAALNILLLVLILFRIFAFVNPRHRPLIALMLFAYFPTMTALKMGQDSIITTFLLVETFISLKCERYALAGGLLALGLYKPQFVLPVIGLLALNRRWSSLLGFFVAGLLIGVISVAMVGWTGLVGLLSLWLSMFQRGHVVWPELMLNLRGLVHMVLNLNHLSGATNMMTLILSGAVYTITWRLWPRTAKEKNDLFDLRFALAIVMTGLVSFHLYSYDGTLLAIPLIIMLNQILRESGPYPLRHRLFLASLIAWFLPIVPNALLTAGVLAWWALPLPIFFAVLAREISLRSAVTGAVAAKPA